MAQAEILNAPALPDARGSSTNTTAALILVCLAQLMVVIDISIVNVALPSIKNALHFSAVDLQWVVNAYTLVFAGFLLLGGRAADLLGRRAVLIGGLLLFTLASLACGLAPNSGVLIVARAVQGLGGAIISPAALSILTVTFPEGPERNRALGVWGAVAGGGIALGVILGGVLSQGPGWRWVFFVNVPIGILTAIFTPRLLSESRDEGEARSYDVPGAVSATAGLVLLVYALVNTNRYGWGSARTIVELIVAGALLVAFVAIEGRFAAHPLVPLRVFRSRALSGANVVALLVGLSLFAIFFFLTLYMQQVLNFTPLQAGFAYLPFTVGIMLASGVGAVLVNRVGVKWLLVAGLLVMSAGLLLMVRLPVHGTYTADVLPAFIVTALGAGMVFLPMTNAAISGADRQDAGLASALLNTSQQVGGAVGLALLSTIATSYTTSVLASDPQAGFANALVQGFHRGFMVGAGFAVAAAVLALLTIPRNIGRTDQSVETATSEIPPQAVGGIADQIAATFESWEGATSQLHGSGDIELRAGGHELGYLHGDALADLNLPAGVRDEAIANGLAHPLHVLPESDWVSVHIRHPEQMHDVVALLRSAYDRAVRRPVPSPATD
ncbi:MAG TPA: DHA2 family efflux MFS transporter permease subunit [Chloroflexota bacterium]